MWGILGMQPNNTRADTENFDTVPGSGRLLVNVSLKCTKITKQSNKRGFLYVSICKIIVAVLLEYILFFKLTGGQISDH